jgi:hypothetical protein
MEIIFKETTIEDMMVVEAEVEEVATTNIMTIELVVVIEREIMWTMMILQRIQSQIMIGKLFHMMIYFESE